MRLLKCTAVLLFFACLVIGTALTAENAQTGKFIVDDFQSSYVGRFPRGWEPQSRLGYEIIRVRAEGENQFLRITSNNDSVYVGRELFSDSAHNLYFENARDRDEGFSLHAYPVLSWRWRVHALPEGGDERRSATNDSGAGVAVGFKSGLIPYSLKYVWSTSLPEGTVLPSPGMFGSSTRIFVLRSGEAELGQWKQEERNILEDYRKAFDREPSRFSRGIAFLTDSNDTSSTAKADYDEIILHRRR